jgi:AraC family transcriptional regulator, transcriptional activator of the genes for pyochelin and ferripyochelin receptors
MKPDIKIPLYSPPEAALNPEICVDTRYAPDIPEGSPLEQIRLRPGLDLVLADFTHRHPLQFTLETREVPFEFSFHLAGRPRYNVIHADGENRFSGAPGLQVASAFPHARATMEIPAGEPVRLVALHLYPVFFETYRHDDPGIPDWPELRRAMDRGEFSYCFRSGTIHPHMALVASQLLDCPFRGMARQLFYESRAMDLIVRQLDSAGCRASGPGLTGFSPVELAGIRKVQACVSRSLENPPGLFDLARMAGMSHTKLNRGFKALFGTTVFGYLRQCRLDESRRLMEKGEMNLAEIAYATGFSSPSHFAKAFSNRFGMQPSACMKTILNRRTISLPSV